MKSENGEELRTNSKLSTMDSQLPRGYKRTEVGVIPEDWEVAQLGEIGTVIRGASPRPKGDSRYYGGNVPRLMVEDVTRDGMWVTPRIDTLTEEGAKRSRPCRLGTLTVVCSGTPGVVGTPALLAVDACIHDGMLALARLKSGVSAAYLYHQLRSIQEQLFSAATHGGTFVNLTTDGLRAFKVVLPPTQTEQEAVVAALNDVDALLSSLDRLIAKKRDIKQAAMQELLTGKMRLPGFEGEWEVRRIGALGATYGGLIGKSKDDFGHGNSQYVTFMNVMANVVIHSEGFDRVRVAPTESQNHVKRGDLLFNGSSETPEEVAMCAFMPEAVPNLYLNSFCFGFRILDNEQCAGLFLAYYMRSSAGRELMKSLAQGSTRYNLSKNALLGAAIVLPAKEEQTAIATILSDMDSELTALEALSVLVQATYA